MPKLPDIPGVPLSCPTHIYVLLTPGSGYEATRDHPCKSKPTRIIQTSLYSPVCSDLPSLSHGKHNKGSGLGAPLALASSFRLKPVPPVALHDMLYFSFLGKFSGIELSMSFSNKDPSTSWPLSAM